jgi:hypothetical protein
VPACSHAAKLQVSDAPVLMDWVRLGRIDAMVTSVRVDAEELVSVPLHPEPYRFVGAASLLDGTPFSAPGDAMQHTLIDTLPTLPLFRYLLDTTGGPVWPFQRREYLGAADTFRLTWRSGHPRVDRLQRLAADLRTLPLR